MPDLKEDHAALGMHRVGDQAPTLDLFGRIDAGSAGITPRLLGNIGRLGNDQTTLGRALAVIFGIQRLRHIARLTRAHPSERRHDDTVGQFDGSDADRREKEFGGHDVFNLGGSSIFEIVMAPIWTFAEISVSPGS